MVRRFALYSDIHGNSVALDAVLADIDASGIAERYCLGDLVGYGPDSSGVIARVRATGDPVIRGNYDDGVGGRKGSCGCYYGTPEARADGEASYAFTDAALTAEEHAYLTSLLDEVRFEVEGVRVLLVHGSPRRINEYLMLDRPEAHLAKLAEQAAADVICFGHIHIPYHREVPTSSGGTAHFISDGSAGRPKDGDVRACWAEVAIDATGSGADEGAGTSDGPDVGVIFHRVPYDVDAVVAAIDAAGLPARLGEALRC
jgi:predicted phosphodiesterase